MTSPDRSAARKEVANSFPRGQHGSMGYGLRAYAVDMASVRAVLGRATRELSKRRTKDSTPDR